MGFLRTEDVEYLTGKEIAFQEKDDGGTKGIILKERPLPRGRYDASRADILIVLPQGYPDVAPDMFYLLPWVKLVATSAYPSKADHPYDFAGQRWQRWSRHNSEWRIGIDGIWTHIKRVDEALEKAA